jgi:hypothetical protein
MVPTPITTAPAALTASLRRTAVQHSQTHNSPRITSAPSVAASTSEPVHAGASATAAVSDRYADAEAPVVTSVAPASPSPPGDSRTTVPAPAASRAVEPSSRGTRKFL